VIDRKGASSQGQNSSVYRSEQIAEATEICGEGLPLGFKEFFEVIRLGDRRLTKVLYEDGDYKPLCAQFFTTTFITNSSLHALM
jgi:hypothetical protein